MTLFFAATYLDAKYDSFTGSSVGDLSGEDVAGVSPLTSSIGFTFNQPFGNRNRFTVRGDYHYESEVQDEPGFPNQRTVNEFNAAAGVEFLGLGLIAVSFILTQAAFPIGAKAGEVSDDTLWRLGAYYVPTVLGLWLAMIAVLCTYRLGRADDEDNLRKLAESRATAADPSPGPNHYRTSHAAN